MTDIGTVGERAKFFNENDNFTIEKLSFLSYFL